MKKIFIWSVLGAIFFGANCQAQNGSPLDAENDKRQGYGTRLMDSYTYQNQEVSIKINSFVSYNAHYTIDQINQAASSLAQDQLRRVIPSNQDMPVPLSEGNSFFENVKISLGFAAERGRILPANLYDDEEENPTGITLSLPIDHDSNMYNLCAEVIFGGLILDESGDKKKLIVNGLHNLLNHDTKKGILNTLVEIAWGYDAQFYAQASLSEFFEESKRQDFEQAETRWFRLKTPREVETEAENR